MDVRNGEREALALEANLVAPLREAAARKMDRAADLAAAPDMAPGDSLQNSGERLFSIPTAPKP